MNEALGSINLKINSTQTKPSLIEHHLGFMLASNELLDIANIKHMVDEKSNDLGDILSAIEH